MLIPINKVSLASTAEKIISKITEETDTVDNMDDYTPWSLNVAVYCVFIPYYWSKRSKNIYIKQGSRGYLKHNHRELL